MATNTTASANTLNITLSGTALYWLYAILLVLVVVGTYAARIIPTGYGVAGIGAIALAFFWTIAHEFEATHVPNGTPYWVTFVVVSVAAALEGAIGYWTSAGTPMTMVALFGWAIFVLQGLVTTFTEDQGANVPQYVETVIIAFLGGAISFLTYLMHNPDASVGAMVAAIIAIIANYLHVTTQPSLKRLAAIAARPT